MNLTPKQESLLAEAGLAKPVAGEPWHIELADRSKVMSPQEAYAAGIEEAEGEGSSLGLSAMGQVKADQREFFGLLYHLLVDAERGPRLPTLILALGTDQVRSLLGG